MSIQVLGMHSQLFEVRVQPLVDHCPARYKSEDQLQALRCNHDINLIKGYIYSSGIIEAFTI